MVDVLQYGYEVRKCFEGFGAFIVLPVSEPEGRFPDLIADLVRFFHGLGSARVRLIHRLPFFLYRWLSEARSASMTSGSGAGFGLLFMHEEQTMPALVTTFRHPPMHLGRVSKVSTWLVIGPSPRLQASASRCMGSKNELRDPCSQWCDRGRFGSRRWCSSGIRHERCAEALHAEDRTWPATGGTSSIS